MKRILTKTFLGILMMLSLTTYVAAGETAPKTFTPEVMMQLYRISSPELSPDGTTYLYSRTLPNLKENNSKSEILVGSVDRSGDARVLPIKGHSATFLDSETIAYISTEGDIAQIALVQKDGTGQKVLSDFDFPVTGFLFSPARDKVVVIRDVELPNTAKEENPDLDKITGRIMDDLMYKHWDEWKDVAPQPFLCSVDLDMKVGAELVPILGDNYFEAPIKPFGGVEQFCWSPDGTKLAYSSKKKIGLKYAISTDTDIYLYDLQTEVTTNLTKEMMGYDTNPTFSSDGNYLAWLSMERDGYEADLPRLFVMDMKSGEKKNLAGAYEYYIEQIAWLEGVKGIRFLAPEQGLPNIFEIDLQSGAVKRLTHYEMADVTAFSGTGDQVIFGLQSMKQPTDLYALNLKDSGSEPRKLTTENDTLLAEYPNIEVQKRWITTTDNKKMLTWVVLPPNFNPNEKYPAILYCQGGPQNTVSQFWSYRWNLRTFASQGYVIVAPNRRGVPGFDRAWNEQISGDWGGQNMKDLLTAIDEVSKEPFVDEERLGATGASYGGFTVFWLAGNHEGRFKSFAAHAGIFNFEAQYLETEEKFFANWDMGGAYWEKENPVVQHTYANSPHRFVDKWDTPILITHGNKDYRILASQGMQAFDAAKLRGIPTRMLYYPDENHWILQPQNGVLFYRTWFDWMGRWLKR